MITRIGVILPTGLTAQLFSAEDRSRLERLGPVTWWAGQQQPSVDEAARLLADCDVAIGSWGTPHPGRPGLLSACPRLRLWEHAAGTVKSFFTPEVIERGLVIASCKGAIADTVAEYVIGALVNGLRRVHINSADHRRGPVGKPEGIGVLMGSTIGVIGASEVGRRVIALLQHFRCRVLCFDPFADAATLRGLGAERVEQLGDLFARSAAVTLHTPRLPSTVKMVGAAELARFADGGLFINTSRGECVDEAALIRELERGRLHAWLDVTDPEPAAADSPLRRLPNVVLTSHIAGPACQLIGQRAVDDVAAFLAGQSPQCVVTPDMLERIA